MYLLSTIDIMKIPVIINNRDRLTTLRKLIDDLILLGYSNIFVLDNQSTYKALLEYYQDCPAEVIYLNKNIGHTALWGSGVLKRFPNSEWIVYTDSDIELNKNTQRGFIEKMITIAQDFRVNKVGLAIQIHDLPDNKLCNQIRQIEGQYWTNRLQHTRHQVYNAKVDTTFHVLRNGTPYSYDAIRVGGEGFTIKHCPWYLDWNNLSEEEQYYFNYADSRIATIKQLL